MTQRGMIHPFQPQASYNRSKHTDWLDDVRHSASLAYGCHMWPEKIIQSKNMNDVILVQSLSTKTPDTGIPCYGAIPRSDRQVDRFHSISYSPQTKHRSFRSQIRCLQPPESPVDRQHSHLMAASRELER